MNAIYNRLLFLLLILTVFFPWSTAGAGQPQDQFTFILPAPAVHQALQTILPLPLEPDSSSFDGTLSIDSIDTLTIHDEMITLHGIISGKRLTMNTKIAGQNIKLRLGQLTMPLSCDLHLRFDQARQQLFVTPQLKPSLNKGNQGGEALLPLLAILGNRDYPVDLKKLLSLNPTIGGKSRHFKVKTVQITANNNQLVLRLRPQKIKSN